VIKMLLYITKSDIDHVLGSLFLPAHYALIFGELCEVYESNVGLSLNDILDPFKDRSITSKIPGTMNKPQNEVRYSDYLIPLFYTSYICRNEESVEVIKEVLGLILEDKGHFYITKQQKKQAIQDWGYDTDFSWRKNYWSNPDLTKIEEERAKRLYLSYLSLKDDYLTSEWNPEVRSCRGQR